MRNEWWVLSFELGANQTPSKYSKLSRKLSHHLYILHWWNIFSNEDRSSEPYSIKSPHATNSSSWAHMEQTASVGTLRIVKFCFSRQYINHCSPRDCFRAYLVWVIFITHHSIPIIEPSKSLWSWIAVDETPSKSHCCRVKAKWEALRTKKFAYIVFHAKQAGCLYKSANWVTTAIYNKFWVGMEYKMEINFDQRPNKSRTQFWTSSEHNTWKY